jgi:hypothetical protein
LIALNHVIVDVIGVDEDAVGAEFLDGREVQVHHLEFSWKKDEVAIFRYNE